MREHWLDRLAKRMATGKKPDPYAGCIKRSKNMPGYGPKWDCYERNRKMQVLPGVGPRNPAPEQPAPKPVPPAGAKVSWRVRYVQERGGWNWG